jgi:selenocysteine lyase/cysteine desulfurase
MAMSFDVARIRGLFPALGDGWVHLDGSAGMLVPEQVASAVSTCMRAPVSGPGGVFPASHRSESIVAAARRAVADLVGGEPAGRFAEAEEVAEVVAFLAGEGAGYITGQTVAVDGGMTMQ